MMVESSTPVSPARRKFLKRSGWVAAGLTVAAVGTYPLIRANLPVIPTLSDPKPDDGFAWVQMLPDGRVRFFCPRMEMGQGASLGLSQIVAEELNLSQDQIECLLPNTSQINPVKMTVGSESIFSFLEPVARSAAALRELLRQRAANIAGLKTTELADTAGGFISPEKTILTYSNLVGAVPNTIDLDPQEELVLYSTDIAHAANAVGQSWRHPELHDIVTGKQLYSRDIAVPDMVFGAVKHPPSFGARIIDTSDNRVRKLPFVVTVVINKGENFAGVVTDNPFKLDEALEALHVEWDRPHVPDQTQIEHHYDVETHRANDNFQHTLADSGSDDSALHNTDATVNSRYDTSFLAHCPMEPRASIVWVRPDQTEVWCGTQDAYFVRGRVARIVGQDQEQVVVHPHRMGGAFGGRIQCQPSEEAARLSQSVGRPVRVQWDRETELSGNYFQPVFSHLIYASASEDGQINHWQHDYVTAPIMLGPMRELLGRGRMAKGTISVMDRFVPDMGSTRGAEARYHANNKRIRFAAVRTPVPTSAWRGLGAAPNAFAIECVIDELAHNSGVDPLQFRLLNLSSADARLAEVLRVAAEMAGWPRQLGIDRGLGIASAIYKDLTPVAIVAEVHVNKSSKTILTPRIWCAHDCGRIVNPDQVRNLIEGNIVWGCSMALKERITVKNGTVAEQNFHLYEPLRHKESADVDITLIEPPDVPPMGVGESALPPVAPAIANAIFAATGRRLRRLPMSFDDLELGA